VNTITRDPDGRQGPIVHLLDDDIGSRSATARVLGAAGFRAVTHASVSEFLLANVNDSPQCVLLDLAIRCGGGVDLLTAIRCGELRSPVIFMSESIDVATSVRAMKAGASDFLVKPIDTDRLLASVHRAIALDTERSAEAERLRLLRSRYDTLSDRERWLMAGVVQGKLNKQLAVEMYMSERTVKAHRARVMSKLHVESMPDLVRISLLLGLPALQFRNRNSSARAIAPSPAYAQ
jgi:FixJ family two-component response regulator